MGVVTTRDQDRVDGAVESIPPRGVSDLFDPKLWFYDPVCRRGLPYDGMRPCSCGSTRFLFITRGQGDRDHHVCCERCYPDSRYRLSRPHDLVYAKLDVKTRVVTYTKPIDEIIAMRSRIRTK